MKLGKYQRLSGREREEISRLLASGSGPTAIARELGQDKGAVSREISGHGGANGYRAFTAAKEAAAAAASR